MQFQLGRDYKSCIAMLLILKSVLNKNKFKIGVEIEGARMFDDLVLLREEEKKQFTQHFQVKYITKKKIESINLLTSEDSDFSIVKYFFSYKDMIESNLIKEKNQEELIVYTNCTLNMHSSIGPKMIMSHPLMSSDSTKSDFKLKKLKDVFERVVDKDNILDVSGVESYRYKISRNLSEILKAKANEYNLTRLARALNDWLLGKKIMQQVEYIVKPYWKFLTNEVIDVYEKKLRKSFLQLDKKFASKEVRLFHMKMAEEINRKNINLKDAKFKTNKLSFEYLNTKLNEIYEYPKWELGNEEFNVREVIKFEEIQAFLKIFVLATGQPNEVEIKKFILQQILKQQQEKYGNDDFHKEDINRFANEIFEHFHVEVVKWTSGEVVRIRNKIKETKYKTDLNIQEILEWKSLKFDVKHSVKMFMGRDEELKVLHDRIRKGRTIKEQTNVICGLPGVGKSELVREYIKKHSSRHENKILWINGKCRESMEGSFRELAEKLNIAIKTCDGKLEDMEKVVEEVYREFQPTKCLFIFDDVPNQKIIDPFMPKDIDFDGNLPFIIITSSNPNWETYLKLDLMNFTPENAVKLVKNQIGIKDLQKIIHLKPLVEILEFFPLAVQQMAVYIEKKQREDLEFEFKNLFENFSKYAEEILKIELPEDISSYKKTTYANFSNIIDTIIQNKDIGQKTIEILGVMSLMAKNDIEKNWFFRYDLKRLDEIFQLLNDYSIIRIEFGVINVECLVQFMTRLMMNQTHFKEAFVNETLNYQEEMSAIEILRRRLITESQSMEEFFVVKTLKFFENIYPEKNSMFDLETKRMLISHLKVFILHVKKMYASSNEEILYVEKLLQMLGACYYEIKKYAEGKLIYKELHAIASRKYGENHVQTASTLEYLALAEKKMGKYDSAKSLYEKVCIVYLKNYSNHHVKTAEAITNLAIVERQLGNYQNAKLYHIECYDTYKKTHDEDHMCTATVSMNLAIAELYLGNYALSKSHFEKIHKTYLKNYGENHVETFTALFNLASAERYLGNYEIAETYYYDIYKVYSEIYGDDHVETAAVLMNLATAQSDLEKYVDAKIHIEKVFAVYSKYYGDDHVETATVLMNLTNVEINLMNESGDYSETKSKYDKVLQVYLKAYGENHVKTATVRMNLAIAERNLKNYDIAKILYDKVFAVYLKNYGDKHVKTATVLMNSAVTKYHMGNYVDAKSDYEKVLEVYSKFYGENHMETARALMNSARTESKLGKYELARSGFQKVLAIYRNSNYGQDHAEMYAVLLNLADTESDSGHLHEAKSYYEEVFTGRLNKYGEDHLETATALMGLANTERKLENNVEAKSFFKKVFNIYIKNYGEDHVETATVMMGLADAEMNLKNYPKAKLQYDKVLAIRMSKYGDDHVETAAVLNNLGILEHENKNFKIAGTHLKNALKIYEDKYGSNHTVTIETNKNLMNVYEVIYQKFMI